MIGMLRLSGELTYFPTATYLLARLDEVVVRETAGIFAGIAVGEALGMAGPYVGTVLSTWMLAGYRFDIGAGSVVSVAAGKFIRGTIALTGNGFDPTGKIVEYSFQLPDVPAPAPIGSTYALPVKGLLELMITVEEAA